MYFFVILRKFPFYYLYSCHVFVFISQLTPPKSPNILF